MAVSSARASCPEYASGFSPGIPQVLNLDEASGLAASRRNPGVLWTHNDDWNDRRIYAIRMDGSHIGTFTMNTVEIPRDPEDIAVGPGPTPGVNYIYWADTGDNNNVRADVKIFRAAEPEVPSSPLPIIATLPVETITLVYPDGPRDCEAFMVDTNGDFYLVAKRINPGAVYRCAFPQSTTQPNVLTLVGQIPWGGVMPTAADISEDGDTIIVRGYTRIHVWSRAPGQSIGSALSVSGCPVPNQYEPQGESVCFSANNALYLTLSEGWTQPLYAFDGIVQCQTPAQCDDGDPCTIDLCNGTFCEYVEMTDDSDGDGVPDCRDECPDSSLLDIIGASGCPLQLPIDLNAFLTAMMRPEPDPVSVLLFDRNGDHKLDGLDLNIITLEILGN